MPLDCLGGEITDAKTRIEGRPDAVKVGTESVGLRKGFRRRGGLREGEGVRKWDRIRKSYSSGICWR